MVNEDREPSANEDSKSPGYRGRALSAFSSIDEFLSGRNIAAILILLLILSSAALFIVAPQSNFFRALTIRSTPGVLLVFTLFLSLLYASILYASIVYRWQLIALHRVGFGRYLEKEMDHKTPKLFSVWVLPIISILLVLAAQIIAFHVQGGGTASSGDSSPDNNIPYMLAFTFATSVVLLMIGMELSYMAQDHSNNNRWIVLVTASLILDFISYFVLVVGLGKPDLAAPSVGSAKAIFTFLLGAASLVSSYFTIAQARMWDEVLLISERKEN